MIPFLIIILVKKYSDGFIPCRPLFLDFRQKISKELMETRMIWVVVCVRKILKIWMIFCVVKVTSRHESANHNFVRVARNFCELKK